MAEMTEMRCRTITVPSTGVGTTRARLEQARTTLAECHTLSEVKKLHDFAESLRVLANNAKLGRNAQNHAAEIALLAARKAGQMLGHLKKNQHSGVAATIAGTSEYAQALRDCSIAARTARYWQAIAAVTEEQYQKYMEMTKADPEGEITASGFLNFAFGPSKRPEPQPSVSKTADARSIVDDSYSVVSSIDLDFIPPLLSHLRMRPASNIDEIKKLRAIETIARALATLADAIHDALPRLSSTELRPKPTIRNPNAGGNDVARARFEQAPQKCLQRHIREYRAELEPREQIESLQGAEVVAISKAEAASIILPYEWLETLGCGASAFYGLKIDGELLGTEVFGAGSSPQARNICGSRYQSQTICLMRGGCVHYAPKNAASFLISRACRQAFKDYGWQIFFAYADPSGAEIGTIYQASNWMYYGQGRSRHLSWHHPDGSVISCYNRKFRTKLDMYALSFSETPVPQKHRYVWFEGTRMDKLHLRAQCQYPILPYPRRPTS